MRKKRKQRKAEKGASIVEATVALCILCFIFFALLQVYQWCVNDAFCEYGAFYTAKGLALGYDPVIVWRSARVAAIGISGPAVGSNRGVGVEAEEEMAESYMVNGDYSGVWYEYWSGGSSRQRPELYISGSPGTSGDNGAPIINGRVELMHAPLLHPNLAVPLGISAPPNPVGRVTIFNYSGLYMEDE